MKGILLQIALVLSSLSVVLVRGNSEEHRHHHRYKHPHGFGKHDSSDSYPYKPNPRYQCQENEEDLQRIVEHAKERCKCPLIYAPVCGTDDITYQNRCILMCAAKHQLKYQGHQRGRKLEVKKLEPCGGDDEDYSSYEDK